MRWWEIVSDRERFAEKREADLLDEHAEALVAGRLEAARSLRGEQNAELAALMALAEEISLAVAPVPVSDDSLVRIRRRVERGLAEVSIERVANTVRLPGRNTVLGAAIVGTAAVSLGRFALSYHRKRQEQIVSIPN